MAASETMEEKIGLFLGAGASYELGMPLVRNLSDELRGYLLPPNLPNHLIELNAGWRASNGGFDDNVISEVTQLLEQNELSYESILGHLQTCSRQQRPNAKQYHNLYIKFLELIYFILYPRQKSLPYIMRALPPFKGLEQLIPRASPLWIFSLNHDVMVELIAQRYNIPLKDGFWPDNQLKIFNSSQAKLSHIMSADILSESDLEQGRCNYFKQDEQGINLFKLHGSLDTFMFREGLDFCRLNSPTNDMSEKLKAIETINEGVARELNYAPGRALNEIMYYDEHGEIQFLRRNLLAGAQKFNKRFHQTLPHIMLDLFKGYINFIHKFYVIGYGFGDAHVDEALRVWLEADPTRSMVIVNPGISILPTYFSHLSLQVALRQQTASSFFEGFREVPLNMAEQSWRILQNRTRNAFEEKAKLKWPNSQN